MSKKLEQGVALPKPARNPHIKYPFKVMEVDESFFVAFEEGEDKALAQKRIYAAVSWANKNYPPKIYVTRTVEGGLRVWRTE